MGGCIKEGKEGKPGVRKDAALHRDQEATQGCILGEKEAWMEKKVVWVGNKTKGVMGGN